MKRIGLLSDTHSYLDPKILFHFEDCDEIWHAGDFGNIEVLQLLQNFKPLKGVYGNIDSKEIKLECPLIQSFHIEGMEILMIHIGGYPGHYSKSIKELFMKKKYDIFLCGHSHILKIMNDHTYNILTINPGAAGIHGFHQVRTIMKFDIDYGKVLNMKVIELGKRA